MSELCVGSSQRSLLKGQKLWWFTDFFEVILTFLQNFMVHFHAFWSLSSVFASSKILARDFIVVEVGRDFSSASGHCRVIDVRAGSAWSSRRLTRKLVSLRQLGKLIRLWNSRAVLSGHQSLNFCIWNFAFYSLKILFLEVVLFLYLRSMLYLLSLGFLNFLCSLLLLHLL